jgi:MYXO-CTERM domain-containing protein
VEENLREQFDRAVGDDPGADPGPMAYAAIAGGGRIRRRVQVVVGRVCPASAPVGGVQ